MDLCERRIVRAAVSQLVFTQISNLVRIMTLQPAKNGLDLRSKVRDSCLKHPPQDIPFHVEIIVNQNVAHADDGAPWHIVMGVSKSCAQFVGGLANDLHLGAKEPSEHLVLQKPRVILPGSGDRSPSSSI